MRPLRANPRKVLAIDHLVGLVPMPDVSCKLAQHFLGRRLQVPEQGELRDPLRRADWVSDEVPETTPSEPIEARGGFAPHAVVSARVRPDLQASSDVSRGLSWVLPVEKEFPAVLPAFDALEVLAPIALVRAQLPPEILAKITAEVGRSVEVENQVPGLVGQDTGTQLAKRRHLAMVNQPVHQAVWRARQRRSRCHAPNLGRLRHAVCKS